LVIGAIDREKSFRAAQFVASAGVTAQEIVQGRLAAVAGFAIVLLVDRLFAPAVTVMSAAAKPARRPGV